MNVSFVINEPINRASGGYKMVYMYANALSARGDQVKIFYRCRKDVLFSNYKLPFAGKLLIARICAGKGPKWYPLNKKVERKIITEISDGSVGDADVVIATAADTADGVNQLSKSKGKKFYFIQGYEIWVMPKEELQKTYAYRMEKIVVANWLKNLVSPYSKQEVICVPNGIDQNVFHISMPVEERNRYQIAMMYHDLESKGSDDGIKVLIQLKRRYPQLKAHLFGIPPRPETLPEWIAYTYCAKQEELAAIYNSASIYLCPSRNEGFPLTGAEAMMCGCALVATNIPGIREYANDHTALLVPVRDIEGLEKACSRLIEDETFRIDLAKKGHSYVSEALCMQKSADLFVQSIHREEKPK